MQNEYGAIFKDFSRILCGKIILKNDIDVKEFSSERRRSVTESPEIGHATIYDGSNKFDVVKREDDTEHDLATPHTSLGSEKSLANEST